MSSGALLFAWHKDTATDLTAPERAVLLELANAAGYADQDTETDPVAWLSVRTLCARSRHAERTVQRAVAGLIAKGLVTVLDPTDDRLPVRYLNHRPDRRPPAYLIAWPVDNSAARRPARGVREAPREAHGVSERRERGVRVTPDLPIELPKGSSPPKGSTPTDPPTRPEPAPPVDKPAGDVEPVTAGRHPDGSWSVLPAGSANGHPRCRGCGALRLDGDRDSHRSCHKPADPSRGAGLVRAALARAREEKLSNGEPGVELPAAADRPLAEVTA